MVHVHLSRLASQINLIKHSHNLKYVNLIELSFLGSIRLCKHVKNQLAINIILISLLLAILCVQQYTFLIKPHYLVCLMLQVNIFSRIQYNVILFIANNYSQQILTDRFAKTGDASSPCQDLRDYCGGSYQGIIDKLDYIQGLGANAIWISPIPEQTDKGYHGYWQKNIYNLNEHFGTSDDLKRLVSECHKRDIWVMVDV